MTTTTPPDNLRICINELCEIVAELPAGDNSARLNSVIAMLQAETDAAKAAPTQATKSIYDLELGEFAHIGPYEMTRVPGGWLTITVRGTCFVPFNNEFQPRSSIDENLPF